MLVGVNRSVILLLLSDRLPVMPVVNICRSEKVLAVLVRATLVRLTAPVETVKSDELNEATPVTLVVAKGGA